MEESKTLEITQGDFRLFWNTKIIGCLRRISPRSYYAGERAGFVCGFTVGLVGGFVIALAVISLIVG